MTHMSASPRNQGRSGSLLKTDARTKRRNAAEARFRMYGIFAISVGLIFLVALLFAIIRNGVPAFTQTFVTLQIELDAAKLDKKGNRDINDLKKVSTFGYAPLIDKALLAARFLPYHPFTGGRSFSVFRNVLGREGYTGLMRDNALPTGMSVIEDTSDETRLDHGNFWTTPRRVEHWATWCAGIVRNVWEGRA